MKKALLAAMICTISLFSVFAWNGVADCTSTENYFYNPASVFAYNQASKFLLSTGFADYHSFSGEYLLNKPTTYLKAEFISSKLSFSIDTNLQSCSSKSESGEVLYDMKRNTTFNFNVATGLGDFSFGAGIYGGSSMEKKNVSNILYQAILGKLDRTENGEFIYARVGALYSLKQFTLGVVADQVLSYDSKENEMTISKALDYISFGSFWSESKYAKRGRLKEWVFNAGFECSNIFNNSERALSVDGEATLQLTNEHSVSFRTTTTMPLADFDNIVQGFCVGARLGMFDVSFSSALPIKVFTGNKEDVSFILNMTIIK